MRRPLAALALAAACHAAAPQAPPPTTARVDPSLIDERTDPCDDFFQYACGGWIARTPIPAGKPAVTILDPVIEESSAVLRAMVEDAARGQSKIAEGRQVSAFWSACNAADDPEAEAVLAAELARIDAVTDRATFAAAVARLQLLGGQIGPWTLGSGALFGIGTDYDLHEPGLITVQLDQGGIVLPLAAYADESDAGVKLRTAYHDHVGRMLALSGGAAAGADTVIMVETLLAAAAVNEHQRRDPAQIDHLMSRRELQALAPHLDWDAYFSALGRPDATVVNVMVPPFYQTLDQLIAGAPAGKLRAYLRWHLLHVLDAALPARFTAERQTLIAALTGASSPPDRSDTCVEALNAAMGEALGALYVERRFSPAARQTAEAVADRVVAAFAADLDRVTWLDAPTRAAAHAKLARLSRKIGAPARPRSFTELTLDPRSRARNQVTLALFNSAYWLRRAGTRPPRDEWLMTPQSLDAYYDVARNEMVFPAALFQPPFFYPDGHLDATYGNVGWVMSHELSHGFDSEGRKYDAGGTPRSFWSPAADEAFRGRAECVAAQYSAYEPLPGVHLDGKNALLENIADVGGLKLSYQAYVAARGGADDADADRRFFLARAQASCEKTTDEMTRAGAGGLHSPWKYRVNGPIADLPAFARAYKCRAGAPMAPVKPCEVW